MHFVAAGSLKWLLEEAEQTWEESFNWETCGMQTMFDPSALFVFTLVAAGVVRSSLVRTLVG